MEARQAAEIGIAVDRWVHKYWRRAFRIGMDQRELAQVGWLAALSVLPRWDSSRGVGLRTFLWHPIRFAMLREILRASVPVRVHRDAYALTAQIHSVQVDTEDLTSAAPQEAITYLSELTERLVQIAGEAGADLFLKLRTGEMSAEEAAAEFQMTKEDILVFETEVRKQLCQSKQGR